MIAQGRWRRWGVLWSAAAVVLSADLLHGQTSGFATGSVRNRPDHESFLAPPPQDSLNPGFWKVQDSVQLFVLEQGEGRPILFLHGGPGMPPAELPAGLRNLAAEYRVLCPHQRGCGRSTRPLDRFTGGEAAEHRSRLVSTLGLEQQVADLERIRRLLGEDELLIIGHSYGAFLAALYAAEFPEHVEKLVLVCPAEMLRMPHPSGGIFEEIRRSLPADSVQRYQAFLGRYFMTFGMATTLTENQLAQLNAEFGTWFESALDARISPDSVVHATRAAQAEGVGGFMPFAIYFSLGMQYDYRAALSGLKCPVLLLHGEKDLATREGRLDWEQALPLARVETLQGTGHFPFDERATDFARIVQEFLSKE
jgi:proline iminopeptidase